jgi:predicted DNA-binding transcriptional regulator YafY
MQDDCTVFRQWRLLQTLCARRNGIAIGELAREFGVTPKTIRRNLDQLKFVGFPIEETTGERGRKTWRLPDRGRVPPMAFSYDEAVVLYLAWPLFEPLAGTHLWEAAHRAQRKIRATLNEQGVKHLERLLQAFHYTKPGHNDYSRKSEMIDSLTLAIEDRKVISLTYRSVQAAEAAVRDVHPYNLVHHKGALYLFGLAVDHEEIRNYKVDRIEAVEQSNQTFQRPADFEIESYLADSFGIYSGDDDVTIVIKFLPPASRYACESKWHANGTITQCADGSAIARLRLSTTVEIKSWVLSFGASAVVLEPAELRAEILDDLERMREAYRDTP